MTKTMRKVAGQINNPELMALWAGQGHILAKECPAPRGYEGAYRGIK